MHDLEDRIREWTEQRSRVTAPVTAHEVWERSACRRPRRFGRLPSWRLSLLASAAVLLAAVMAAVVVGNDDTTDLATLPGPDVSSEGQGDPNRPGFSTKDFAVAWTDEQGDLLPDGLGEPTPPLVINTIPGPEHCGWESATIMHLAVPLGEEAYDITNIHTYVRDPSQVLPPQGIQGSFVGAVGNLPEDARFSGFRNGDIELWVAPSTFEEVVYVGRDGRFEAWPREVDGVACG